MCGIYIYLGSKPNFVNFDTIKHRGPDDREIVQVAKKVTFGFHRLAINDLSANGNQPFIQEIRGHKYALVCNGEIYNHKELEERYQFEMHSKSDCEVIMHLYDQFGMQETVKLLDGVFAFALYDYTEDVTFIARDPIGVRPLFMGFSDGNYFASEAKALNHCRNVRQFAAGTWWSTENPTKYHRYFDVEKIDYFTPTDIEDVYKNVRVLLENAVKKRIMSDRPIGCLLSGGLDSSLVAGILHRYYGNNLHTFSIGMAGSTDLKYAQKVAKHLGIEANHHTVTFTADEGLDAVREVIRCIESFDITTIRASVGMYLVSKYIKENTDITVIYSGEGADEVAQGYLYFHDAPCAYDADKESKRLIADLPYYDVLRSDRTTSAHSLEVRVPFLDKEFIKYYLSVHYHLRVPIQGIEKYIIRKAFEETDYLPYDVLWRTKEAFSDGVSSEEKSWYEILQDQIEIIITDKEMELRGGDCPSKEAYYYKRIYNEYYKDYDLTPYYWMPKWNDTADPSARTIQRYQSRKHTKVHDGIILT